MAAENCKEVPVPPAAGVYITCCQLCSVSSTCASHFVFYMPAVNCVYSIQYWCLLLSGFKDLSHTL
jgi:hypothetical protein